MREIRFRVWDKSLELMVFIGESRETDEDEKIADWNFLFKRYDDIAVMQFIGLKDKNGKEIYEGDIVQVFYDKSEQREEDKAYIVVVHDMMQDRFTGVGEGRGEVIGNIYENPELLK